MACELETSKRALAPIWTAAPQKKIMSGWGQAFDVEMGHEYSYIKLQNVFCISTTTNMARTF
jgi:hypothetical protein